MDGKSGKIVWNGLIVILASLILAACGDVEQPAALTQETETPNPTITNTPTKQPTLTLTPTPTLTPTLLPTLGADEAISFTQNLLENNNGCEFPCWWGIVPGESSWEETEQFLRRFVLSARRINETEFGQIYLIVAPVSENIDSDGTFDFSIIVDNNNGTKVQEIIITESFQSEIPSVLQKYGEPDQIWFWTNGPSIYNEGYLFLFYQDRGMLFTYMGDVSLRGNDSNEFYFLVCSSTIGRLEPQVRFWSPSDSKDFYTIADQLLNWLALTGHREVRQLEQISDTTVHEFFTAITDGSAANDFCFHSDVGYWEDSE